MADLKTAETNADARAFVAAVEDDTKRADCEVLLSLMGDVVGEAPRMWGDTIVGFGKYSYTYASGRSGEWMLTGFSPRKQNLTVYIMCGFDPFKDELSKLGKAKTSKSCLYIKRLSDIDLDVLTGMIAKSAEIMRKRYA